jgi:acetyltransferase-like isoleucine patch superfamily enzyme
LFDIPFNTTGHEFKRHDKIQKQLTTTKEIIIEDDVWIRTMCQCRLQLERGAVIVAGAVVNKSIPTYEVWARGSDTFYKNRD